MHAGTLEKEKKEPTSPSQRERQAHTYFSSKNTQVDKSNKPVVWSHTVVHKSVFFLVYLLF